MSSAPARIARRSSRFHTSKRKSPPSPAGFFVMMIPHSGTSMMRPRGHSYTIGEPRDLREDESNLLITMLGATARTEPLITNLAGRQVYEMNDGCMGSLRFVGTDDRKFGSITAEATFHDEDGIPVSAAVIVDQRGDLYELDLFKADFSPLRRIPALGERQIKCPQ